MAMTEAVKDELGRLSITKPCCRKAEVSALLRFAGGSHRRRQGAVAAFVSHAARRTERPDGAGISRHACVVLLEAVGSRRS